MASSPTPPPHQRPSDFAVVYGVGPAPFHLITNAASLRLGRFLRRRYLEHRHHVGIFLRSSIKNFSHIGDVLRFEEVWHERSLHFRGFSSLVRSCEDWEATCSSWFYLFSGDGISKNTGDRGKTYIEAPRGGPVNGRKWTNIILAINVLVYLAQFATQGRLLYWGAKINSLIDKGQLWRLATSSFLHVNCYSLNSVGPTMESLSGPRRFLVVYIASAIASSAMSYWLSKSPAVGASGAIFGLVGSFAVFALRHNKLVKGGVGDLQYIGRIVVLNMAIGLLSQGIDNWGHLGGLIGGAATSWLIGPAWKFESISHGRKVLVDKAPILSLTGRKRAPS